MKNNKTIYYKVGKLVFLLFSVILLMASCNEDGPQFREFTYPEQTVTDFSPAAARPTENVTINGSNFGTLKGAVTVYFNGVATTQAELISVADNQIIAKVPAGATSGKVTVKVWTNTKEVPGDFTFIPGGEVASVSPAYGVEGGLVTINGKNFGTDPSIINVIFGGGINGSIVSVTNSQIKATIPVGSVTGNLTIKVGNQLIDGGYFLVGEEKLTGTVIGTSGSYQNNPLTTIAAAFDGNITTFVDGAVASGYIGYDLGTTVKAQIKRVRFYPRAGNAARMTGVKIYGTNDLTKVGSTNGDLLYTIAAAPAYSWNEAVITSTTSYRYVYLYYSAGNMNVSELEFYGKKD